MLLRFDLLLFGTVVAFTLVTPFYVYHTLLVTLRYVLHVDCVLLLVGCYTFGLLICGLRVLRLLFAGYVGYVVLRCYVCCVVTV